MVSEGLHKILIVDNEPLIVEELSEFLSDNGFACVGCLSASDAIRLFHQDAEIGIVLSDFRMPEMNGIELMQMLGRTTSRERIFEGILFTGNAEKEDVITALRAGIADYYQKPLDLDEVIQGIKRLTQRLNKRYKEHKVQLINDKLRDLTNSLAELCHGINSLNGDQSQDVVFPPERPVPETSLLGYDKLSPRQLDVAGHIAKGLTNYQISCELGISENTVKLYVSQILRATNMHNRTQLALALGNTYRQDERS